MDNMTENDYLIAWGLYALAAIGCLLVWIKMTAWMWRYLREPLWVLVLVLLATPTLVEPERGLYAPAIAITALDLLFNTGSNAWRSAYDLTLGLGLALLLYLGWVLLRRLWSAGRAPAERPVAAAVEPVAQDAEVAPPRRAGRQPFRQEPRL